MSNSRWVIEDRNNNATICDSPRGKWLLAFTSKEKAHNYIQFFVSLGWVQGELRATPHEIETAERMASLLQSMSIDWIVLDHSPLAPPSAFEQCEARKFRKAVTDNSTVAEDEKKDPYEESREPW